MFHPFAHPVTCCCVLLGVVVQSLKPVKILVVTNGATTLNNVGSCWPTMISPFARFFFIIVASLTF